MSKQITEEDFYNLLAELMNEAPASHLLSVPGVYEAVSEHFNNDVLALWESRQEGEPE